MSVYDCVADCELQSSSRKIRQQRIERRSSRCAIEAGDGGRRTSSGGKFIWWINNGFSYMFSLRVISISKSYKFSRFFFLCFAVFSPVGHRIRRGAPENTDSSRAFARTRKRNEQTNVLIIGFCGERSGKHSVNFSWSKTVAQESENLWPKSYGARLISTIFGAYVCNLFLFIWWWNDSHEKVERTRRRRP